MHRKVRNSSLQNRRSMGRIYTWASKTSLAIVLNPPVMIIATFRCTERSLLVMPTDPWVFLELAGLWRYVYHTSTPYVNHGIATVLYSCCTPVVDMPLDVLVRRQILEDQ